VEGFRELMGEVVVVDYFQWRGRVVAGGAWAEMDFG
jgi:hypothetical protein